MGGVYCFSDDATNNALPTQVKIIFREKIND